MRLLIGTLLLALSVAASVTTAHAGPIRQWIDPETGIVTFGDAPTDASAAHVRVQPSSGLGSVFCDAACVNMTTEIEYQRLVLKFRKSQVCRRRWHVGDDLGKDLAKAAREECAGSMARMELGLEDASGNAQALWAEHYGREVGHRERMHDRAVIRNEGWQNRVAIERQTDAIEDAAREQQSKLRDQTDALRDLNRSLDRGVGGGYRYLRR